MCLENLRSGLHDCYDMLSTILSKGIYNTRTSSFRVQNLGRSAINLGTDKNNNDASQQDRISLGNI